jgi:hypothetical protein
MKRLASLASLLFIFPVFVHAQSLQLAITNTVTFVNRVVIPFLFGLAFLFFVINAIRFFVYQGATTEGREKAKQLSIYGVFAFVIIIVFWGVINLLAQSIGLEKNTAPTPDYVKMNGGDS